MTVSCFYCEKDCEDYAELARHIMASKNGHGKGRRWAAKYLSINSLSPEKRHEQRQGSPLTAQDYENREKARRVLSGTVKTVSTVCPNCHQSGRQVLPMEYIESKSAWRTKSGTLIVNCPGCQKSRQPWRRG
jgi:hypothetical protein